MTPGAEHIYFNVLLPLAEKEALNRRGIIPRRAVTMAAREALRLALIAANGAEDKPLAGVLQALLEAQDEAWRVAAHGATDDSASAADDLQKAVGEYVKDNRLEGDDE